MVSELHRRYGLNGLHSVFLFLTLALAGCESDLDTGSASRISVSADCHILGQCEETMNDDSDGDGVFDQNDNCPMANNRRQLDRDRDGLGDACDSQPDVRTFTMRGQTLGPPPAAQPTRDAFHSTNHRFRMHSRLIQ